MAGRAGPGGAQEGRKTRSEVPLNERKRKKKPSEGDFHFSGGGGRGIDNRAREDSPRMPSAAFREENSESTRLILIEP